MKRSNINVAVRTNILRGIYDQPKLYDELFPQRKDLMTFVERCIQRYGVGIPKHLLDPACGPGHWLRSIEAEEKTGVDIDPNMVAYANEINTGEITRIVLGDMRALEYCIHTPVDLVVNLEGTLGHLATVADVEAHLTSTRSIMAFDGLYFLGCPTNSELIGTQLDREYTYYPESGLASGERYTIVYKLSEEYFDLSVQEADSKHVLLSTRLRVFDIQDIADAAIHAGFELANVHYMNLPDQPASKKLLNLGDATLVLRAI